MGDLLREPITDMQTWIQAQQKEGKTTTDTRYELYERGIDMGTARAIVMAYWDMGA